MAKLKRDIEPQAKMQALLDTLTPRKRPKLEDALALYTTLLALYRAGHRLVIVTAQGEHIDPLEDKP